MLTRSQYFLVWTLPSSISSWLKTLRGTLCLSLSRIEQWEILWAWYGHCVPALSFVGHCLCIVMMMSNSTLLFNCKAYLETSSYSLIFLFSSLEAFAHCCSQASLDTGSPFSHLVIHLFAHWFFLHSLICSSSCSYDEPWAAPQFSSWSFDDLGTITRSYKPSDINSLWELFCRLPASIWN